MPGKNERGRKSSRPKRGNTSRERSSPEKLSHARRYEGYDEERSTFNPAHGSDYGVDENDIDSRAGEYKDDGGAHPE